jgi:hypothetical protein
MPRMRPFDILSGLPSLDKTFPWILYKEYLLIEHLSESDIEGRTYFRQMS